MKNEKSILKQHQKDLELLQETLSAGVAGHGAHTLARRQAMIEAREQLAGVLARTKDQLESIDAEEAVRNSGRPTLTTLASIQRWDVQNGSVPAIKDEPTYKVQLLQNGSEISMNVVSDVVDENSRPELATPQIRLAVEVHEGLPRVLVYGHADELQMSIYGQVGGKIAAVEGNAGPVEIAKDFSSGSAELVAAYLRYHLDNKIASDAEESTQPKATA